MYVCIYGCAGSFVATRAFSSCVSLDFKVYLISPEEEKTSTKWKVNLNEGIHGKREKKEVLI